MSHFTVTVVGEDIDEQLAPFQENNMGDCPKEYLEFNDTTEECEDVWENDTFEKVVMPDGRLLNTWDEEFRYEGIGVGSGTHKVPEYLKKREVPMKELYNDFDTFVEEYFGYKKDEETGAYGYWSNPNCKWDWYSMGGRWTGFFKLKPVMLITDGLSENDKTTFDNLGFSENETQTLLRMYKKDSDAFYKMISKYNGYRDKIEAAVKDIMEREILPEHAVGSPGIMTEPAGHGYADQAYKKDIDWEGMMDEAGEKAGKHYDIIERKFGGSIPKVKPWSEFLADAKEEGSDIDQARDEYHKQPGMVKFQEVKKSILNVKRDERNEENDFIMWSYLDDFQCTREEYVEKARNGAICTFAILKDGEWIERGSMGWWAVVSDEKDDWESQFRSIFDSIKDDELITLVDCHI